MKKYFTILFLIIPWVLFSQKNLETEKDTMYLKANIIKLTKYYTFDTIPTDTNQEHIELTDRFTNSLIPYINLGQNATASLDMIFSNRTINNDFWFLSQYDRFIYHTSNPTLYNTNKPYTDIQYIDGQKLTEEQTMNVLHTQTFGDSINIGIKYNMFSALNLYTKKDNNSVNALNLWFYKNFKKYYLYVSLFSNKVKVTENGGIIDTSSTFDPFGEYTFYISNSNVKNTIKNSGFYLNHAYNLNPKIQLNHIFQYETFTKTFSELSISKYLGTPELNTKWSFDSIGLSSFDNKFIAKFGQKTKFFAAFNNRIQIAYYYKGIVYNLKGKYLLDNYISGGFDTLKFYKFKLSAFGEFHFTDRKQGNVLINGLLTYHFSKNSFFSLNETFEINKPDYFLEHYNGNYQQWELSLKSTTEQKLEAKINFTKKRFEIGGNIIYANNYVYFDSSLVPLQYNSNLVVLTAYTKKTFRFFPFASDLVAYYQKSSNSKITNIPEIVAAGSFYLDISLFQKALLLNIGLNVSYTSNFYQYGYSQSLGIIYNDYAKMIGKYPIVDLFMSAKIKTAIIIVRFDHADGYFLQPFYATTAHYHLPAFSLRFGARWWFRN